MSTILGQGLFTDNPVQVELRVTGPVTDMVQYYGPHFLGKQTKRRKTPMFRKDGKY